MIEPTWDVIRVTTDEHRNYAEYPVDGPGLSDTLQYVVMTKVWWAQLTPSTLMGVMTSHHYAVAGFRCERCKVIVFASELAQLKHDCDEIRDYRAWAFRETAAAAAAATPRPAPRARTEADLWL